MSRAEADALKNMGLIWYSQVNIGADDAARDGILQHINAEFVRLHLNVTVSRGWQPYDLVVKVNNQAHTYPTLVQWATGQADGGVGAAQRFYQWYMGDDVALSDLPPQLLAFAVITHLAEVARGYSMLVNQNLDRWITWVGNAGTPAQARERWGTYKDSFKPSTTYAEEANAAGTLYAPRH